MYTVWNYRRLALLVLIPGLSEADGKQMLDGELKLVSGHTRRLILEMFVTCVPPYIALGDKLLCRIHFLIHSCRYYASYQLEYIPTSIANAHLKLPVALQFRSSVLVNVGTYICLRDTCDVVRTD